jgi:hypothetical protein
VGSVIERHQLPFRFSEAIATSGVKSRAIKALALRAL